MVKFMIRRKSDGKYEGLENGEWVDDVLDSFMRGSFLATEEDARDFIEKGEDVEIWTMVVEKYKYY